MVWPSIYLTISTSWTIYSSKTIYYHFDYLIWLDHFNCSGDLKKLDQFLELD